MNELDALYDRTERNLADLAATSSAPAQPPPPMVVTSRASSDGMICVTVTDAQVTSLEVDRFWLEETGPTRAWPAITRVINEALTANAEEVLAAAKDISPGFDELRRILRETRADLHAASRELGGL